MPFFISRDSILLVIRVYLHRFDGLIYCLMFFWYIDKIYLNLSYKKHCTFLLRSWKKWFKPSVCNHCMGLRGMWNFSSSVLEVNTHSCDIVWSGQIISGCAFLQPNHDKAPMQGRHVKCPAKPFLLWYNGWEFVIQFLTLVRVCHVSCLQHVSRVTLYCG